MFVECFPYIQYNLMERCSYFFARFFCTKKSPRTESNRKNTDLQSAWRPSPRGQTERKGFEPLHRTNGLPVFQSGLLSLLEYLSLYTSAAGGTRTPSARKHHRFSRPAPYQLGYRSRPPTPGFEPGQPEGWTP